MLHFTRILLPWFCALYTYSSQQFWELTVCTAIFLNYIAHLTGDRNTWRPKRQERFFFFFSCRSSVMMITHWVLHFTFPSSLSCYRCRSRTKLGEKLHNIGLLWPLSLGSIVPNLWKIAMTQVLRGTSERSVLSDFHLEEYYLRRQDI